jgi:hypothetical protein
MLIRAESMQTQEKRTKSHKASRVVGKKGESRMMRDDSKDEDDDDAYAQTQAQKLRKKQTGPSHLALQPINSLKCHLVYGPYAFFFFARLPFLFNEK